MGFEGQGGWVVIRVCRLAMHCALCNPVQRDATLIRCKGVQLMADPLNVSLSSHSL